MSLLIISIKKKKLAAAISFLISIRISFSECQPEALLWSRADTEMEKHQAVSPLCDP